MVDRKAMLAQIRNRIRNESNAADPTQFRIGRINAGDSFKAKVIFLPGLRKGDKCATGAASATMDEMEFSSNGETIKEPYFCVRGGYHWINKKPHPCPRLFDGNDCMMCETGFDLLNETDVEEERSRIGKLYLPSSAFLANIYFPKVKTNPENLRGKVFWYQIPKTLYDKLEACLLREDAGDDPDDPQPHGDFYYPTDCYMFQIAVKNKNGYNNYDDSKFIVKPISLAATDEEIEKILAQRHDIMAKVPARTTDLSELVNKLMGKSDDSENSADTDATGDDDEDDMPAPRRKAAKSDDDDDMPAPRGKAAKSDDDDDMPAPRRAEVAEDEKPKNKKEKKTADDMIDDPELQDLINEVKNDA